MHAFTDMVAGMISLGDKEYLHAMITSTTQLSSTVLAEAPELAFIQSTQPSTQRRAVTWKKQPFAGLVNAAAATKATLPFQQALEQLFQNITISLMSAPDLQYIHFISPSLNGRESAVLTSFPTDLTLARFTILTRLKSD